MTKRTAIAFLLFLLLLGALVGCSAVQTIDPESDLSTHIVRMDRDGSPMDLEGKKTGIDAFKEQQLMKITSAIGKHAMQHGCANDCGDLTIAIYVHGAPLLKQVKVQESRQKLRAMQSTNPDWYPIAFNWPGTLGDVYADHLFRIRNGRSVSALRGAVSWPLYFIGDALTGAARIPGTWFNQLAHIVETEYPQSDKTKKEAQKRQILIVSKNESSSTSGETTTNNDSGYSCNHPLMISDTLPNDPKFSPATPAQFIVEAGRKSIHVAFSPFIASLGSSMWKNYNRRAQASVRQSNEYEEETKSTRVEDGIPTGAFAVLMDELIDKFKINAEGPNIILIGHSTGAIIISEYIGLLLARHGVDAKGFIDKIVFLGSAASVEQFNKTIVPYLRNSEDTKFYNISLNGYDEAKTSWYGLQTMSLLEWLDSAVARPASHAERVMGKWENMMLAMHTIPCEVRDQVHLKHLPSQDGFPRRHSELDEVLPEFNAFKETHWEVR